jgi:hypothetical protein
VRRPSPSIDGHFADSSIWTGLTARMAGGLVDSSIWTGLTARVECGFADSSIWMNLFATQEPAPSQATQVPRLAGACPRASARC